MNDRQTPDPSSEFRFSPRPNRAGEIRWRVWSDQAFREAQEQDKPILLAISAVWCHWCHVMDETSYSDPAIIQAINEELVPIRVDNDRRPDVNERYNMGGWPTTVFLTPTGDVITGGTYIPPEQMGSLLPRVLDYYRRNRDEISARLEWARAEEEARRLKKNRRLPGSEGVREAATQMLRANFDPVYGGLGTEPKFPYPDAWKFLLLQWQITGDDDLRDMVTLTLEQMRSSELYDAQEGGFFRYATTRDWRQPHYEKMLEDNAALLDLCVRTWGLTGQDSLRLTTEGILHYLMSRLYQPQTGAFSGSQDADEAYYKLPLEGRRGTEAPYVDPTVYAGWNGVTASALASASVLLDEPRHLETAAGALRYLFDELWRPDEGMLHCQGMPGLLADQVNVARACLDLYEATGEAAALGRLRQPSTPILENSVATEVFARLHHLIGEEEYRQRAEDVLRAFGADYGRYGALSSAYARALYVTEEEPLTAVVVGAPEEETTRQLRLASLRLPDLHKVVLSLDPRSHASELDSRGYPSSPSPAVYLCARGACSEPVLKPEDVEAVAGRLG